MQRLTGLDAGFLYMETPTLHMHTLKVAVLDPAPGTPLTFEQIRDEIRRHLPLLPSFRRRLVRVPFAFHHPLWVEDPDFDLDYHVRRVVLPSPGTRRQLDEAIGDIAGVQLDRTRPLWRMHVFEGLEGGRLAVLAKIHHAVADGMAASALLANVMTTASDAEQPPIVDTWQPEAIPAPSTLLWDAFRDHVRQLFGLPRLLVRTLANLLSVVRHRRRSDVSTPVPILSTPRTAFNTALTPRRSFASTSLPIDAVKEVKSAFGVTMNDVVLAVAAGALRTFLADGSRLPLRPLVAGVPVASDVAADIRLHGNRVSNMFTSLATDVDDPVERLRRIHEVTSEAKTLQRLLGVATFEDWVQYTPPGVYAWFMDQYSQRRVADRHPPAINLVVSSVPGPSEPLYAAGAPLREIYSVGPILEGIGLNITVWSYLDRLYVGALGCRDTLPDLHRITEAMGPALGELVRAGSQAPVVASLS